jgi:putative transposase
VAGRGRRSGAADVAIGWAGSRGRGAKAQRKLARKSKFSANWKKQKAKISRLHMRAANARRDFLQKLSTDLAKSHSVIKIEKLQIQNMTRSARGTVNRPGINVKAKSRLNRSRRCSTTRLVYVDPAYTSQTCAECHVTHKASRINQARFVCAHCGHEDSADVNGARNIHQARALADEPPKRTLSLRPVGKRKHPETRLHAS